MTTTDDQPGLLARRLGRDVIHVELRLSTGEPWHRFVLHGRVLGSGFTPAGAYEDALADRRRKAVALAFVDAITRRRA